MHKTITLIISAIEKDELFCISFIQLAKTTIISSTSVICEALKSQRICPCAIIVQYQASFERHTVSSFLFYIYMYIPLIPFNRILNFLLDILF